MNFTELSQTIWDLAVDADFEIDLMDVDITLRKLSDAEIADLAAMIDFLHTKGNYPAMSILCNVMHDVSGFKEKFLGIDGADCFLPRSHGYAK